MSSSASPLEATAVVRPPRLRVLAIDDIYVHEAFDPARAEKLIPLMAAQNQQAHPVIVTPLPDPPVSGPRFVHIDGANRLHTLRALGCDRTLAQVVDVSTPAEAVLGTWAHLVRGVAIEEFLAAMAWHPRVRVQSLDATAGAPMPGAIAVVRGQQDFQVTLCDADLPQRLAALTAMVDAYHGLGQEPVERLAGLLLPPPGAVTGAAGMLVTFTPLTAAEFAAVGRRRLLLPPGVTRFTLPCGRALGVNMPLRLLRPDAPAAERAARLRAVRRVRPRIAPGPCQVREYLGDRHYDEPLLIYDPAIAAEPLALPLAA